MRFKRFTHFVLLFLIVFTIPAYAVLQSYVLTFAVVDNTKTFGYLDNVESISWGIKMTIGTVNNLNFKVYDKYGTLIQEGTSGSLKMFQDYYPVKFVSEFTGDGRVDIEIIPKEKENLGKKLDEIKEKMDSMNDFLTNPGPLYASMDKLANSVAEMQNKGILGQFKEFSEFNNHFTTDTPDSGGMPVDLTFIVDFPGIGKFNVLDLTRFVTIMSFIRELMTAMIWLSLFIYFLRYILPRFQV